MHAMTKAGAREGTKYFPYTGPSHRTCRPRAPPGAGIVTCVVGLRVSLQAPHQPRVPRPASEQPDDAQHDMLSLITGNWRAHLSSRGTAR